MDNFTNTGLIALIADVLRRRDPALVPAGLRPDPMHRSTFPGRTKQALLDNALQAHGAGLLLSIGQHLHRMEDTPVQAVLLANPDPQVLAQKWMRMERYFHATHRTRITSSQDARWLCERHARGAAATPAENLLIAGVLFGLLGLHGRTGARLVIGGRRLAATSLETVQLPPDTATQTFAIEWGAPAARPAAPPPGGDARPVQDRLADMLAADIGQSWRLETAARRLAQAPRSLQRRLAAEGRSFSSVLRRARMREASRLLTATDVPLAEIGYCCGYADQAHFQRDFLRAANVTPGVYRGIARTGETGARP